MSPTKKYPLSEKLKDVIFNVEGISKSHGISVHPYNKATGRFESQSYINTGVNNPYVSSVVAHERTHDLTVGNDLIPDIIKNSFKKTANQVEGIDKDYYNYLSSPTEAYARMMQIRKG